MTDYLFKGGPTQNFKKKELPILFKIKNYRDMSHGVSKWNTHHLCEKKSTPIVRGGKPLKKEVTRVVTTRAKLFFRSDLGTGKRVHQGKESIVVKKG